VLAPIDAVEQIGGGETQADRELGDRADTRCLSSIFETWLMLSPDSSATFS
jgi:hypothetical protein